MPPTAQSASIKFEFADGLRAVAAIGVAIFHAYTFTGNTDDSDSLPSVFKILRVGDFAVPIFIVLSGFVLMLPVSRQPDLRFKNGTVKFLKRRARRILPPYYAALTLFLILIALTPALQTKKGTAWDSKIPITWDGLAAHIVLLHNLAARWVYQIDGPAWSVATEWQIYFAMPFLLLPLWRRLGRVS